MRGWIIIFALIFAVAVTSTLANDPLGTLLSLKLTAVIFGMLLVVCTITRLARGQV